MQMSLISLTRKPGKAWCQHGQSRKPARPATVTGGPRKLAQLGRAIHSRLWRTSRFPAYRGNAPEEKKSSRLMEGSAVVGATVRLNQQCSVLPGVGGSFSPRVSRSIPTVPTGTDVASSAFPLEAGLTSERRNGRNRAPAQPRILSRTVL